MISLAFAPRALAQGRGRVRRVGYLRGPDPDVFARPLAALGWDVGKNLQFETRENRTLDPGELGTLAAELVGANVDALLAFTTQRVRALAEATRTIPIVCAGSADPVGDGFARTLQRPGGNITGLSYAVPDRARLLVGLLRSLRPSLEKIVMNGPSDMAYPPARWAGAIAKEGGLKFDLTQAQSIAEFERLFATLDSERHAVIVDGLGGAIAAQVAAIAIRRRVVVAGSQVDQGLLAHSYLDHSDQIGRTAAILDKVLRGGNPAGIPFELPDRSVLIINQATAKAIGLAIPPEVLLRATRVIG